MLWFGGFRGRGPLDRVPVGALEAWPATPGAFWLVDTWPGHQIRHAHAQDRVVVVIGSNGAKRAEVERLVADGIPDDIAWRWPGSYTVVQAESDATTIWTDLGGASPIYTLRALDRTYWASSARALAALNEQRIDRDRLAAWLLAPAVPALLAGRSAFADISLVPAGHRMTVTSDGQVTMRPVWLPRARRGAHATRLRNELQQAVDIRVDAATVPTADLSGGYDSSALALLAGHRLAPDRAVTAVTVHPEGVLTGGDLAYSELVARRPGIVRRLLPIRATELPFTGLERVPVTDEPAPSTIAHARFNAQLRWMHQALRSDCHLTGDGGDSLLCSPPLMLAVLLRTGHHGRALTAAFAWARLRRVSATSLLTSAAQTARTPRPVALRSLAGALRTGRATGSGAATIRWFAVGTGPSWATSESRERAGAVAEAAPTARDESGDLVADILAETMADVGRSARADAQLAEAAGISLHNPFVDSRVLDTCLSIPLTDRPGPAEFKPILRTAMADLFPAELADRTTKGSFTSDYYGGLRTNLHHLQTLAHGYLADLGLIDADGLARALRLAAAGIPSAFNSVEPAIRAEAWLRALDAAPAVGWIAKPPRGEVRV